MITNEKLIALGDYLDQHITLNDEILTVFGCDHTLTHTIAWLQMNNYDQEAWLNYIQHRGGFCDCEVRLNVIARIEDEDSPDQ